MPGNVFAQGKEKDGTRTVRQTSAARELDDQCLELDIARQPLAFLESKTDLLQRQSGHLYKARITSICCLNQDKVPGRYIASPVPVGMLAAASTRYVRREGDSYPACEVDNEKDEQKGPKNAATNIHLILR